jgi:integrase/recombinase XerD
MRASLRGQRRRERPGESLLRPQVGAADGLRVTMAAYLEWCRVRQYTEATVNSRADTLKGFADWCEERSLSRPAEVTRPLLERYQRWLFLYRQASGRPLSAGTQHGRLQTLKGYFRWLVKQGRFLVANPAADLELPRRGRHLPQHVLAPAEVEMVLALPDVATPEGLRDRAMLEVLYSTGLRRMELLQLNVFSVSEAQGTVSVRQGKGRKDRVVPIGERALAWLRRYLEEARPKLLLGDDEGVLFLSETGMAINPSRLTAVVGRYVRASGVAPRGACHLFRHVVATAMLENGADIRFVQEMLGHAHLATTEVYTHVSIAKLKQIHQATHPAAKLQSLGLDELNGDKP